MARSDDHSHADLIERVGTTLDEVGARFPYYADPADGSWTTTPNGNWCGGHWLQMLWHAHVETGEERFERAAREGTSTMVEYMPRRSMFCGMNFHHAGFRAYDLTGEERYRALGIEGADAMVAYFDQGARQIPLGILDIESPSPEFRGPESDEGPSGEHLGAVDAIHTSLPVLWRAFEETGDPVYRDTAISHADRHLDWYIREDGRTWHHAEFDPDSGALVRQYNELAFSEETCWARGQGWCIAGLARAYEATEAERYLRALNEVTAYYVRQSPPDLVPHWDFEHPNKPNVERDTSAAAIAAYGLALLSETEETRGLVETGERIRASLLEDYVTPRGSEDERPTGMVLEGCYNGPSGFADHHELLWTDYYLLEALAVAA